MSYTLVPYIVDLEALRRAVGSRDKALLAAIVQADPGTFAEEETDEGEVSLGRALRDLIMGEPPERKSAHQYGYALEALCRHLGEDPGVGDNWCEIRWAVLEATGMEEVLSRSGPPVPLPQPPNDSFPAIGHLTAQQVAGMAAKLADGPLKTAAPSGRKPRRSFRSWLLGQLTQRITGRGPLREEDLRELLDEYADWLRAAAAKGRGLVFFYY